MAARSINAHVERAGTSVAGAVTGGATNELLPEFGSDVALETPALLVMGPVVPGAAVATSVKVPVAPVVLTSGAPRR